MPPRFGGAPKCPRCEKSVYMAEQVLGPGGPWHNYCLTCKECNKRLDSTTLTEKENEAYCRTCYNRRWGPKGYGFAGGAAFLSTESKMPSEILKENELNSPVQQVPDVRQVPSKPELPVRREVPALPTRPPQPPVAETEVTQTPVDHHHHDQQKPAASPKPSYLAHKTGYVPRKFNFQAQNDICTGCKKAVYAAELVLGAGNKYHKMCLKCSDCGKRLDSTNMVDRDFDLYCRGCYSRLFGPKGYGFGNLLTTEGATR
ncbi:hypothetical protein EDC94DRAFT_582028 [Helicostylum pulchrum]|uniref:LIM zinc-binding domain-containing protein n=1 Tax=Helicostylum pulchrum TaxID=562976 RepID=A0ABP9YH75_9FUNG|nr:hypothetical protein EDC94DRAFT_582028 [Helicostylum pulchrum]